MGTVLLGEAPKRADGFAFDADSWTTGQIAGVLGIDPFHLNKVFFVMNVFENPQRTNWRGFDRFSVEAAAQEIDDIDFVSQKIICLGGRVASALELALGVGEGVIPETQFRRFDRTLRGKGWELAYIPHPSGLRGQEDLEGLVLPQSVRRFLRAAAGQMTARRPGARRR